MKTAIISAIDSLKSSIEQLIFDIGQGKEHKVLHGSAIALLVQAAELRKNIEEDSQVETYVTDVAGRESASESFADEVNKVSRKLPKWANKPHQINAKILNLFLFLHQQHPDGISEALLKSEYGNDSEFDRNFPQMKSISPKNHGKVFEITNGLVTLWEPVIPSVNDYEGAVAIMNLERDLQYVHDAYEAIFGQQGDSFGQNVTPFRKGVSDGNQGVQWNLVVDGGEGVTRLGVNLEGMKYDDWPIARFIEKELSEPSEGLPSLSESYADANDLTVRVTRDAWQYASRPPIHEKVIGGNYVPLSELTPAKWEAVLHEAYDCLNAEKNHRGRAIQMVTRESNGVEENMEVSPHITISIALWRVAPPSLESAVNVVRKKMAYMQPIYDHLQNSAN